MANQSVNHSLHQTVATGYIIQHNDIRLADIGTLQEPHLYHITAANLMLLIFWINKLKVTFSFLLPTVRMSTHLQSWFQQLKAKRKLHLTLTLMKLSHNKKKNKKKTLNFLNFCVGIISFEWPAERKKMLWKKTKQKNLLSFVFFFAL